ncbi:MAG: hypothetical protein GYA22_12485, partial [Bacteroidales bacterium]|nr:hypothetical protein [Bacteroidales bacterium]
MRGITVGIALFFAISTLTEAQGVRQYTAGRIGGTPLTIDGRLDEEAWLTAQWAGDFIQHEPYNG